MLFSDYAVGMVGAALNVRYLIFGLSTDFSESCVKRILAKNRLSKLEELKVSKSSDLSIGTIYGLVEICPNLRSIRDMEYWTGISEEVRIEKPIKVKVICVNFINIC